MRKKRDENLFVFHLQDSDAFLLCIVNSFICLFYCLVLCFRLNNVREYVAFMFHYFLQCCFFQQHFFSSFIELKAFSDSYLFCSSKFFSSSSINVSYFIYMYSSLFKPTIYLQLITTSFPK